MELYSHLPISVLPALLRDFPAVSGSLSEKQKVPSPVNAGEGSTIYILAFDRSSSSM